MLLYCSMTLSPGLSVNMDFALSHAVNLAEAGKTVQNKRIGELGLQSSSARSKEDTRLHVLCGDDAKGPRATTHASQYATQGIV